MKTSTTQLSMCAHRNILIPRRFITAMRHIISSQGKYFMTKGKFTPEKDKNNELDREFLKTAATCAVLRLASSRAYDKLVSFYLGDTS